jgi:hypothetical protein
VIRSARVPTLSRRCSEFPPVTIPSNFWRGRISTSSRSSPPVGRACHRLRPGRQTRRRRKADGVEAIRCRRHDASLRQSRREAFRRQTESFQATIVGNSPFSHLCSIRSRKRWPSRLVNNVVVGGTLRKTCTRNAPDARADSDARTNWRLLLTTRRRRASPE